MIWRTVTPYRHPRASWLRDIERVQRQMNRVWDAAAPAVFPAVNITASADELLLTAELPGVGAEDVDLSIEGNVLTLSGERRRPELAEGERFHRQERRYGRFSRTVRIPFRPDANGVEARFENGLLLVTVPRAEEDKPRKIAVTQ